MSKFLDRRKAAVCLTDKGLPTSWKTLQKMATTGGGPPYHIWGNRAVYSPPRLDAWAEERLGKVKETTSES